MLGTVKGAKIQHNFKRDIKWCFKDALLPVPAWERCAEHTHTHTHTYRHTKQFGEAGEQEQAVGWYAASDNETLRHLTAIRPRVATVGVRTMMNDCLGAPAKGNNVNGVI